MKDLIQKWRTRAENMREAGRGPTATALEQCANELEAAFEPYLRAWRIAEDGLASIAGERTPEKFPETSYDLAARKLRDARALLPKS